MTDTTPGWEGTQGPFPGQYGKPHVYARDVHSGAGNCVCGRQPGHRLHVQPEIDRLADDLKWARSELAKADAENRAAGKRAEQAEREAEKLRRQVQGYRGMKDCYLKERNAAHKELIEAENLIERLCAETDRLARQPVIKAAITEQRERAEQAEAAIERVRALHVRNANTGDCEHCSEHDYPDYSVPSPCPTIAALDQPKEQT